MKNKMLAAGISLLALSGANAGVVTFTNVNLVAVGDTIILGSNGSALQSGTVEAGYFTTGFDVTTAVSNGLITNDFSSLLANWNSLGSAPFYDENTLGAGVYGYYFGASDYGSPAAFLNKPLYTMIGGLGTLALSLDVVNGGSFALLSSSEVVNGDTPTPDSNLVSPENSSVLVGISGTTSYDYSGFGGAANSTTPSIQLYSVVPEPSAALLGALGALGLLRRRRI